MERMPAGTEGDLPRVGAHIGLLVGLAATVFFAVRFGWVYGAAAGCVPLVLCLLFSGVASPYWAFAGVFVANYFVMGLTRYVPGLPGGVVIDALLGFSLLTLLIRACYKRVDWSAARNGLTGAALVWLIYCVFELFNPRVVSAAAWAGSVRGVAIYLFVIAVLTPVLFGRYRDLKRILYVWSVLTLLAVLKAVVQKFAGFDAAEVRWLFLEGGSTTHVINSGVRYFSFFTDAANFGAGMGLSMVVFSITALYFKRPALRLWFFGVALAAAYGMVISGTRGALAVPFAGYTLYLFLTKSRKIMLAGVTLLLGAFVFLNYTYIGEGNQYVRRMRSAFNFNDRSFRVRLENQAKMREYMKDKPFGIGIGLGGGKAKVYAPDAYMSQIPTDSWFVMIWVETGIVGLALHVGLLLYIFGYGVWLIRTRIRDPQLRGLLSALLAGTFGIAVSSYGNEIMGQFPNGIIVYMSFAFVFLGKKFDREIAERKRLQEGGAHGFPA